MNLSSDTFSPLQVDVVPTPRRVQKPALPVPVAKPASEAAPARFVPLVESDDTAASLVSREHARAAGFAAGFAAGSRRAAVVAAVEAQNTRRMIAEAETARSAEHDRALELLAAATRAVAARQVPVLDAAEHQIHMAALELATAVLGMELSDGPTSAQAALARTKAIDLPGEVVVRLSPRDARVIGEIPEGMRVVADATVADGDAIAQHADGELDARISSALARARAVLTDADS